MTNGVRDTMKGVCSRDCSSYVVVAVVSVCVLLLLMGCCFVFSVSLKVGVGFSPMVGYTSILPDQGSQVPEREGNGKKVQVQASS